MTGKPIITKLHTLGKNERLKSHKIITALFKDGQSFSNFPLRVLYLLTDDAAPTLQAGFSVSSKNFKKAVDRNRIKRLLRESYRLQKIDLQDQFKTRQQRLNIFFIYTGRELPDHHLITEKMKTVLHSLIVKTKDTAQ